MSSEELPHRQASSRRTSLTDSHAVHTVEDGEYKQEISSSTDPSEILGFFQKLIKWYESDVHSREELFLHAEVTDGGRIRIRDQQGGEWLCWSAEEWTRPHSEKDTDTRHNNGGALSEATGINENVVRAIVNALSWTYEAPSKIKDQFDRVQVESCAVN